MSRAIKTVKPLKKPIPCGFEPAENTGFVGLSEKTQHGSVKVRLSLEPFDESNRGSVFEERIKDPGFPVFYIYCSAPAGNGNDWILDFKSDRRFHGSCFSASGRKLLSSYLNKNHGRSPQMADVFQLLAEAADEATP